MKRDELARRVNICFGKNDVRCVYGSEIDEEVVYRLGRAVVKFLGCKKFVVGHDMRKSSKSLRDALVRGLVDSGVSVIDIGMVDTPWVYFASGLLNVPSAMITASHNPAKYNGVKLTKNDAAPIGEESGLREIRKLVEVGTFPKAKKGKVVKRDMSKEYVKHVRSFVDVKKLRSFKVGVDAGNGMGGKIVPLVFKGLPIKIIPQDFKIYGDFPAHDANPSKRKNIKDLMSLVKKKKLDFGMAFDSDMDRVFFVDETGWVVDSSVLAALIIRNLMKKKGANVVYNLVCGKIVPEVTKEKGGKSFKERVGHSFIKSRMIKVDAAFGCEHSAHYYYKQNYYADSGIITALLVCRIFSDCFARGEKFSSMLEGLRRYSKSEEKSVKVDKPLEIIKKVESHFKKGAKRVSKLQGVTIEFDDYWFNVRKSNTEPLLRVNIEANNLKLMRKKRGEVLDFIKKIR